MNSTPPPGPWTPTPPPPSNLVQKDELGLNDLNVKDESGLNIIGQRCRLGLKHNGGGGAARRAVAYPGNRIFTKTKLSTILSINLLACF